MHDVSSCIVLSFPPSLWTYNGGMPTQTNARTRAVGDGPLAIVVQLLVEVTELVAGADCGLPGGGVHLEVLHVAQVNG